MNLNRWLVALIVPFAPLAVAETAGPSLFSGFENDRAGYALIAQNGKVLAGYSQMDENGLWVPYRGVVRSWSEGVWQREYFETDLSLNVIPRHISADGAIIAGERGYNHASVWSHGADGWTRADLSPDFEQSFVSGMSSDGRVLAGWAGTGGSGAPCVWELQDGEWQRTPLPVSGLQGSVSATHVSSAGDLLAGICQSYSNGASRRQGVIWSRVDGVWSVSVLPVDPEVAKGSIIQDLSRDGRSVVGKMFAPVTSYSVGSYVWSFDGSAWQWSRLPDLVSGGRSEAWEISDEGDTVIGYADRNDERPAVRIAWKKTENGGWRILSAGSKKEVDDFPTSVTGDGKLAFAQPIEIGGRLWNLWNNKLLSMPALVAGLDVNTTAAGWDFSEGQFQGLGYDPDDNTYTILGYGFKQGVPTTCVIALYAPFLTGESPTIGGWVDVELPDMGPAGYRMGVLPPGLKYDKAGKRIYGRVTQTGTFKVTYRNLTTGRAKASLLRVAPFSPKQQGVRTIALTPLEAGEAGVGQLRVKVGKAGGVVAHLTPPGVMKPFTFAGVLVPDVASGLFVLRAKRASSEEGCLVRRGKGAKAVQYRVELEMTKAGALEVRLLNGEGALVAEGEAAAP